MALGLSPPRPASRQKSAQEAGIRGEAMGRWGDPVRKRGRWRSGILRLCSVTSQALLSGEAN